MNIPLITWCLIVALFVIILAVRLVHYFMHGQSHHAHRHHLVEIGTEREEFFIPGDPVRSDSEPPFATNSRPDYDDID